MTAPEPSHLLVVDDDDRIRTLLKRFLSMRGFRVTAASDAAMARRYLDGLEFDLLVLDVMMPGEDGLALAAWVRGRGDVPILLLTARGEPEDRIRGLALGADDYLAKPFEPEELALRISAILRRRPSRSQRVEVAFGPSRFDPARGELRRDGALVKLTESEVQLLRLLAARPGEVLAREELAQGSGAAMERSVDVQITRLRRKVEDDVKAPIYIQTVRGVGYKLMAD